MILNSEGVLQQQLRLSHKCAGILWISLQLALFEIGIARISTSSLQASPVVFASARFQERQ